MRSAWLPSLLWNVTLVRPAAIPSIPTDFTVRRSFSQKNLASESRADSTFWLPFRIVAPWSEVSVLATVTKPSIRPVFGLRQEKNFWCSRIEVCSTSGGRPRKSSPILPIRTTGHSTRPATSARRPLSSTTSNPAAKAMVVASCQMWSARSSDDRITWARFSFAW